MGRERELDMGSKLYILIYILHIYTYEQSNKFTFAANTHSHVLYTLTHTHTPIDMYNLQSLYAKRIQYTQGFFVFKQSGVLTRKIFKHDTLTFQIF